MKDDLRSDDRILKAMPRRPRPEVQEKLFRVLTEPGARVVTERPCEWPGGCSRGAKGQKIYCNVHQLKLAEQTSALERLVGVVRDYLWADDSLARRGRSRVRRDSEELAALRTQLSLAEDQLYE